MTAVASKNTTPGASPIRDMSFGRGTIGVLSFIVSPLALALLFISGAMLQEASVTGTPLGSPGGQLGILVAAILLSVIAHSARWSTIGVLMLTGWAGVFAVMVLASGTLMPPEYMSDLESLMQWSQLPLITFSICLAATIATRVTRTRKTDGRLKETSHLETALYALIAVLLIASMFMLLYSIAPISAEPIILQNPSLTPAPTPRQWVIILVITLVAFALTWMATRVLSVIQITVWSLLLIPGLFLVPLLATFTGSIATPNNQLMMAAAYVMPVAGIIGLLIVTTTHSISLMHRLS